MRWPSMKIPSLSRKLPCFALASNALKALRGEPWCDNFVAGGAPRDWMFAVKARNVDLFVSLEKTTVSETIVKLTKSLGAELYEENGSQVWSTAPEASTRWTPLRVHFIDLNGLTPIEWACELPLSIAQVVYQGGNTVLGSPLFFHSLNERILIKMGDHNRDDELWTKKMEGRFRYWPLYEPTSGLPDPLTGELPESWAD